MRRPTSVTVFAVINLILGGFGVFGFAMHLATRMNLLSLPGAEKNPSMALMQDNAAYKLYIDTISIVGILATIAIIAASIGMFQLKPWARLGTIAWGAYSVLLTIIGSVVNHVMMMAPLAEQAGSDAERVGMRIAAIASFVFAALFLGYYLLMILMLCRTKVRQAFEPENELLEPPT